MNLIICALCENTVFFLKTLLITSILKLDAPKNIYIDILLRNVLTESARIARGKITDLARLTARDYDAVVFPGGFGAAKNL